MRPIALRAAAVISIAVALSPAPASAKPPGTPKPQDAREAQRLFASPGGARILAQRVVSIEEVAAVASATEGLAASDALARVTGAEPGAASVAAAVTCYWVEYSHSRGVFPVSPLGRGSDLLVLPVRRRHHVPLEQHLGTRGRRVLRQKRARLEGRRRRRVLVGRRASRGGLLVHHAVVVPTERHVVDGGDLRLLRECVDVAVGLAVGIAS